MERDGGEKPQYRPADCRLHKAYPASRATHRQSPEDGAVVGGGEVLGWLGEGTREGGGDGISRIISVSELDPAARRVWCYG